MKQILFAVACILLVASCSTGQQGEAVTDSTDVDTSHLPESWAMYLADSLNSMVFEQLLIKDSAIEARQLGKMELISETAIQLNNLERDSVAVVGLIYDDYNETTGDSFEAVMIAYFDMKGEPKLLGYSDLGARDGAEIFFFPVELAEGRDALGLVRTTQTEDDKVLTEKEVFNMYTLTDTNEIRMIFSFVWKEHNTSKDGAVSGFVDKEEGRELDTPELKAKELSMIRLTVTGFTTGTDGDTDYRETTTEDFIFNGTQYIPKK